MKYLNAEGVVIKQKEKERNQEACKRWWAKLRWGILLHYGGNPPLCACCNEPNIEFLIIDHIKGEGNKHIKEIGGSAKLFLWLRKNNYPEGFRILCYNCNSSLGHYGYCPHRKLKRPTFKD